MGGAAGAIGIAVASGAGTADTVVTADYNVDGFVDLFVTNGFNLRPLNYGGENKLFRNRGNANRWIELDLVGTNSDRDAVGARVYATAGGKTQMRIQNGGYHRWAQDLTRTHFGLGGATQVSLRIEWPSGATQTFANVATNKLYKVTEGGGISQVVLGKAIAYPCGAPPFNSAIDSGTFIWRDCPSGEWRMKTGAGGGGAEFSGTFTSAQNYVKVKPQGLTTGDTLNYTANPKQISFKFTTRGQDTDGVNFIPHDGASACVKINGPAGAKVFDGPFRKELTPPFDIASQAPCS